MALLRAFLLGDVAISVFPVDSRSKDGVDDGHRKGIGYILKRSFGKEIELLSIFTQEEDPTMLRMLSGYRIQDMPAKSDTDVICAAHILRGAFYLAHVDGSLGLMVAGVSIVAPGPPADLSPPPSRKPRCPEGHGQPEDAMGKGESGGRDPFAIHAGLFCGGGGGDFVGIGTHHGGCDSAPLLSSEEAWRYCCDRRPDFPAMFAVYRHFRGQRYTVHTGHKYGAHFVLYEGSPEECHSRYCVHVMGCGGGGGDSWGHMKTVTRLMPDVAKCLLVCGVTYGPRPTQSEPGSPQPTEGSSLAALAAAEVTALRFSRSREHDGGGRAGGRGGGGKISRRGESATVLKARPAKASTSSPARKSAKQDG
ncbi:unnamed protein product [Hapterophycus canaliculatus]